MRFMKFDKPGSFLGISWRTIYGRDKVYPHDDPYQTSVEAGRLRLHIFWRGDRDPDYHDHMWDFWTFPLTPYYESVLVDSHYRVSWDVVPAWRITKRLAEHAHKFEGRAPREGGPVQPGAVITLVWRGPKRREWGFWVKNGEPFQSMAWTYTQRRWVPWKDYIFGFGKAKTAA